MDHALGVVYKKYLLTQGHKNFFYALSRNFVGSYLYLDIQSICD